jgi:hypothetical protein
MGGRIREQTESEWWEDTPADGVRVRPSVSVSRWTVDDNTPEEGEIGRRLTVTVATGIWASIGTRRCARRGRGQSGGVHGQGLLYDGAVDDGDVVDDDDMLNASSLVSLSPVVPVSVSSPLALGPRLYPGPSLWRVDRPWPWARHRARLGRGLSSPRPRGAVTPGLKKVWDSKGRPHWARG